MDIKGRHVLSKSIGNFSWVTWNGRAPLGEIVWTDPKAARVKVRAFEKLLCNFDAVLIQELHGSQEDFDRFMSKFSETHIGIRSGCDTHRAGGVAICIKRKVIPVGSYCWSACPEPGRLLCLYIWNPLAWISVCCGHLCPKHTMDRKRSFIDIVLDLSLPYGAGVTFIGADWNFIVASGDATSLNDIDAIKNPGPLAHYWESKSGHFWEAKQDMMTHINSTSESRIDRLYCNMVLSSALDHSPSTRLVWEPGSKLASASDHLPVGARMFSLSEGIRRTRVPDWVTAHPKYQDTLSEVWNELHTDIGDPMHDIEEAVEAIRITAKRLQTLAHLDNTAVPLDVQIFWGLAALRSAGTWDSHILERAMFMVSEIEVFFRGDTCTDYGGLHDFIAGLITQLAERRLHASDDDGADPDDWGRKSPKDGLGRWLSLWAGKRKQISTMHILDDNGQIPETESAAAKIVSDYWEESFAAKPCDLNVAEHTFRPFCRPIPQDVEWIVPIETYRNKADRCNNSSPGPDGVKYKHWAMAPPVVADTPYAGYRHIMKGGTFTNSVALSFLSFLVKDSVELANGIKASRPKDLRPLTLSNSCFKFITYLVSVPVNDIAGRTVSNYQRGGLEGRQLVDNLLDIEAKAIQFLITTYMGAGIVLLDIKQAFPSLAREFLFWVLQSMGFPAWFLDVLKEIYRYNVHGVILNGKAHCFINVLSGVKQGCPLSMALFALAIDCVILKMADVISPFGGIIRAFCDDLGLVARQIIPALEALINVFGAMGVAGGLWLHDKKCKLIPLRKADVSNMIKSIKDLPEPIRRFTISLAAKYLGVYIGPEGHIDQWTSTNAKYSAAAGFVRQLGLGFAASAPLHNALAVSRVAWLASIVDLDGSIVDLESRCNQLVFNGPWNALPPAAFFQLKAIGLPQSIRSLSAISIAGKCRTALISSKTFNQHVFDLDTCWGHDERILGAIAENWIKHSIIFGMKNAIQKARGAGVAVFHEGERPKFYQAMIYNGILPSCCSFDWCAFFARRWVRWSDDHDWLDLKSSQAILATDSARGKWKPCVLAALLRTWTNGWVTEHRFQREDMPCLFCKASVDKIEHIAVCPVLIRCASNYFRLDGLVWNIWNFIAVGDCILTPSDQLFHILALHNYAAYRSHCAVRHGKGNFSSSLYNSFLKALSIEHAFTRKSILQWKRGGLQWFVDP